MSDKLNQLTNKLKELFQLNRPDLDFGIYRIMHAKQAEIERFLEKDLLPQVKDGLATLGSGKQAEIKAEIDEAIKQAEDLGGEKPEETKKVRELRAKYGSEFSEEQAEDEIYSHLYNFFARYYQDGDFMSMRRYKEGVYAIPYEGEEVYLHWANKDQYYIKTSENLKNYTFKLDDGRKVTFRILEADTEKDNKKAADDKDRRFILDPESIKKSDDGQILVLGFEYRPDEKKRNQSAINEDCVAQIQSKSGDLGPFATGLLSLRPTDKRKDRTLLEKHLEDYTAKHTFDYFIHKDLGKFLRRELDFYIKNEVMHLDDIEHETAQRVEQYLTKVKVIRKISGKIIDFLAQLENFQKKLWLKKKFVVETNYCITLDRIPKTLYSQIVENEQQWQAWEKLGFLDLSGTDKKDLKTGELALGDQDAPNPRTVEYLESYPHMLLDTCFFDESFRKALLASIEDLEDQCDGLLINSDNFQGLRLLHNSFRSQIECIYIDPPYNSGDHDISYKNGYKHSSWLSLINDRFCESASLLSESPVYYIAIDDYEMVPMCEMLDTVLPGFRREMVIVNHHPQGGKASTLANTHEYMVILVRNDSGITLVGRGVSDQSNADSGPERRPFKRSGTAESNHRHGRPNSFYALLLDPKTNEIVGAERPPARDEAYPTEDTSVGLKRIYPLGTGSSERVWRRAYESCLSLIEAHKLVCSENGTVYQLIEAHEKTSAFFSNWTDTRYNASTFGANLLKGMIGNGAQFSYPKSIHTVADALFGLQNEAMTVLDYFAGSGTTGHAVINLNREDGGERNYILVEMGDYFNTVTKPRIQKAVYAAEWKDGLPAKPNSGISHCFKYIRLESYEDCLNNLKLSRSADQDELLLQHDELREDYMLNYMLDVEAKGSVLNIDAFEDPFAYKMNIATGTVGETKPMNIDLVETFNYLIGLKVKHIDTIRGVRVITGENLSGERILVLWRKLKELDSNGLDEWFKKQGYNTQDMEFDLIYVNGDNNLENLKKDEQTWKVRLIEEEFQRLMFEEVE